MIPLPKPPRRGPKPRKPIPRRVRPRGSRVPAALANNAAWEQKADRLWSFIVRHKSPICVCCHIRPTAQADHLISRRYRATRWAVINGAPLCAGCHRRVTSDHELHVNLARRCMGDDVYEACYRQAQIGGRVDPAMAVIRLGEEVRLRGLTALAVERGLL